MTNEGYKIKTMGKVYTPIKIVEHILNLSGYIGKNILEKHIIDNSCGDGIFLIEIVNRYIKEAIKNKYSKEKIKNNLETYIHGIEIDLEERNKCIKNVSNIAKKYGFIYIKWDIICDNTLFVDKYNGKMSYVVGNPPYVRVHNLGKNINDVKDYIFSQKGMTDLFIVFYEIGLKMLNDNGVLGYISPSSLFNSLAGKSIRQHFIENKLITKVVDFKHLQLFNATTYSSILILSKTNQTEEIEYYEYLNEKNQINLIENLQYSDFYIDNNFYFSNKYKLFNLKKILKNKKKKVDIIVKNGFATLCDKFFIGDFDFENFTIPIIKASTGEKKRCIFPYENGNLVSFEKLNSNNKLKIYFENNKNKLEKRSLEKASKWYSFGRSQGINDVYKLKYSINTVIKDLSSIKLIKCPAGFGVYSGLYILTDLSEKEIKKAIFDEDFINYIEIIGKYRSGGYYTFSSKDLKKYLDFKFKN